LVLLGSLIGAAVSHLIQHLLQKRRDTTAHERARALDHKRTAYHAFLAAYDECHDAFNDPEAEEVYRNFVPERLRKPLLDLETCASSEVLRLAQTAPEFLQNAEDVEQVEGLREDLADKIRSDLELDAGKRRTTMSEHTRSTRTWRHPLSGFVLGIIVGVILGLFIAGVVV